MRRIFSRLFLALFVALGTGTPAFAQSASGDVWQVTFAPYLMGAGMSGTTGIDGRDVTVDASASDIFSNLQFGAMGIFVARKGNWGVGGDFIWMALGVTTSAPPANIDPNQGAFAFYGVRRLGPAAELTFGMRWNVLQGRIRFKGPLATDLEKTKQWVDPLVGLNLRTPQGGRWHAGLYAEAGGFGVGSTFAWQIFPTLGADATPHLAIDVGYRWLDVDYESGDEPKQFKYDVLTQGPALGFVFKF